MMTQMTHSWSRKAWVAGIGFGVVALVVALLSISRPAAAGESVLVRGIVKPNGDGEVIKVYITHVTESADETVLRGSRIDVNVGQAKMYKWQVNKNDALEKVRTTSKPVPEKEVVIKGTFSEDRIVAAWLVQNYREFHIEGVLQDRVLDSGSSDAGYATLQVTKSVMRGVSPERKFKSAALVGQDLRVRINGSTKVRSIGSASDWTAVKDQADGARSSEVEIHFDEVTKGQQQIVLEGQMTDEDNWTASHYWQRNQ